VKQFNRSTVSQNEQPSDGSNQHQSSEEFADIVTTDELFSHEQ
jgi:hypothetical protein